MSKGSSYNIPSKSVTLVQQIKGSKFITTAGRASNRDKARAFIDIISEKYADATHNCYAFVVGNPFSTTDIGFGDDGEVSGTAGKPMLSVLQHKKIGEIVVVVSRYFGGTKLGTGGLVRAYTSSVQLALKDLELTESVPKHTCRLIFDFQHENAVRQLVRKMNIDIIDLTYIDMVEMRVELSDDISKSFIDNINSLTSGGVKVNIS